MGDTSEKSGAWLADKMEYILNKGYDVLDSALLHASKALNENSQK